MSQPLAKRNEYDEHLDRELERWPGVTWSRQPRGKHNALVVTYRDVSRFVIYPASPSDSRRGALNCVQNLRGVLRELGATREAERKSAAPRRERNRTEPARVRITERATGGPNRDPWEALRTLQIAEPPAPQEPMPTTSPEQPETWWARVRKWASKLAITIAKSTE